MLMLFALGFQKLFSQSIINRFLSDYVPVVLVLLLLFAAAMFRMHDDDGKHHMNVTCRRLSN